MNCDRALEFLLEAEPAELALSLDTPLVEHLRGCSRCAAVAARLRDQAGALAMVAARRSARGAALRTAAERVSRRPSARWIPVGAALAATAAIWIATSRTSPSAPTATPARVEAPSTTPAPRAAATVSAPSAVKPIASDRGESVPVPPVGSTPTLQQFSAERMSAVAFASSAVRANTVSGGSVPAPPGADRNAPANGVVSVAPPAGTRATVMQTTDPKVTVVWLQPADTTRSPR